jgi:signal transduction histidine kinase
MRQERQIALALPVLASLYDIAGMTAAIALVDGFDNPNFLLYYPALLAFTLVFPGWWSSLYSLAVVIAYLLVSVLTHNAFDGGDSADVKDLVIRLVTLAGTVLLANLVVQIERRRRERAVAAERAAGRERERIAEEIHDGVSQNVYMLAMNLETLAEVDGRADAGPKRADQISGMVQLAKETLIATRGLLTNLQPLTLDSLGLAERVRNHAREFSAVTGIPVRIAVEGEPREISAGMTGEIYRILQEGLANVYKHAQATEARIQLAYEPQAIMLEIVDNGVGFNVDATPGGHGLTNIRARASRLGGHLSIESDKGRGTRLIIMIPA